MHLRLPRCRCCSNRQVHKLYKSADVTSSFLGECRGDQGAGQAASSCKWLRPTSGLGLGHSSQAACSLRCCPTPTLHSPASASIPPGSPDVLLVYRLLMLAWGLYIGIGQLMDKGPYVFVFYTGEVDAVCHC